MRLNVFVPQPIPASAVDRLRALADVTLFDHLDRRITKAELLTAVEQQHILYGLGRVAYDRDVIEAARGLRLIAAMHPTATYVDIAAATEKDVPVTGIPNIIARTTAEFTFTLVAATAWRIPEAERFLRDGKWRQNQSMAFLGSRLFGKTIGIFGFGAIGREVATRARAFDMTVLYTKRDRLDGDEERRLDVAYRSVEDLFGEADVVVVTAALTKQTKGFVDRRLLERMKPTAFLVNTARGPIVDEAALEDVLREGRIAGAGLDVYARERPDFEDAGPRPGLWELPNVVLTPHIGSAARETREEMAHLTVDAIEAFLAGRRPDIVLNPEVFGEPPPQREHIG